MRGFDPAEAERAAAQTTALTAAMTAAMTTALDAAETRRAAADARRDAALLLALDKINVGETIRMRTSTRNFTDTTRSEEEDDDEDEDKDEEERVGFCECGGDGLCCCGSRQHHDSVGRGCPQLPRHLGVLGPRVLCVCQVR